MKQPQASWTRRLRETLTKPFMALVLGAAACSSSQDGGGECVEIPRRIRDSLNQDPEARTRTERDNTTGCRSFGDEGCAECCSPQPVSVFREKPDCLVLSVRGERLSGGECEASCEPCARCSLQNEKNLRAESARRHY